MYQLHRHTVDKERKSCSYFALQDAVGSSEVFPCVAAAVRSSYEGLDHQAHVN